MDVNTFKSEVLPLNRKLYAFAIRFMSDTDEAKDIIQEIYLKLWNIRDELEKYNSIEALAMRMTRNLCLDKIKLKKTVPLNPLVQQQLDEDFSKKESEQEIKLAANRAKKIIETLDEPDRKSVV